MDPEYALNKSLPYLTCRLEDAGLTVQVGFNQTKGTIFLLLNDSVKCSIHELMTKLIFAEPDVHRDLMDPWIPYLIERTRIGETILNNPDELRRRIRTEFGAFDTDTTPLHSYARQYPGGIALMLSLDYETSSFRLDDERSSPVEWCNRFVSFGVGYALSWSGGSSCPVGWGVSRDLVRMSRLR